MSSVNKKSEFRLASGLVFSPPLDVAKAEKRGTSFELLYVCIHWNKVRALGTSSNELLVAPLVRASARVVVNFVNVVIAVFADC